MNMTNRQREILVAIIEEYAETATPVGSVTLAKLFDVSSATIRAEMSRLEDMGYLAQPHTSAGRIPTDAGYRFYVNSLQEEYENNEQHQLLNSSYDRPVHAIAARIQSQTRNDYAIRSAVDSLVDLTGNLGFATIGNQLYISGLGNLFSQPEFAESAQVKAVAKLLDNIEPWLKEVAPNEPINVYIGTENPIGKTSGVSLIISKFRSGYSDKSYIGIIGPTRQSYQKVMSLVRHTGSILEDIL
ncbi:transcriptional regulator [Candidatus Saccharibacteria bacterium]|nr:transcriptional regulator [Candidatus Saccharibacteria bacterium]